MNPWLISRCLQEMKLFEVAMSLADILLCLPSNFEGKQLMNVGPKDVLNRLALFLTHFRGDNDNNVKLQILHDKMQEISSSVVRQPLLLEDDDRDPNAEWTNPRMISIIE